MIAQLNLARMERRIFRAFWQDGLLDLIAGSSVILIAIGWLFGVLVPMMGVPIVGVFVWRDIRRRVTEPRLGSVEFSASRRISMTHGLIAIASLGLVVGGTLVTRILLNDSPSLFAQWFAPAIPASIVAAMSLSCAAALGLWRFVFYGAAFALAGLGVAAAEMEPWWALLAGGAVVTIGGAALFMRFVRHFPMPSNEVQC